MDNDKCKYKAVERWGLYIMVFLCLINSCSNNKVVSRMERTLNSYITQTIGE